MSIKDDLIGAKGGSASFRSRPDNLRSTDTFEALVGLTSGRIRGLAPGGLKNLFIDDVPIEDGAGNSTLKDFSAVLFNGDPAILQPVTLQLGGSSGAQPVNLPINNPNTNGQPGEWRYGTVGQQNVDYIDLRFIVNNLFRQDKKGIYDATASLEIEFQPSGTSTWINPLQSTSAPTYNENGIKLDSAGNVLYALQGNWQNNNTWSDPTPGRLTITGKTTQPYVKELRVAVPNTGTYANRTWQVRVRLIERDSYTQDENQEARIIQFESIAGVSMAPIGNREEWRGLAYLQINGKASDQLTGIPRITGIYDFSEVRVPPTSVWNAETRTYTGATWDGATEEVRWTQCPAFQLKDLIEDDLSGIAALVPGSTLNKWDALEASKWYAQLVPDGKGGTHPRYSMNYILDNAMSVNDLTQYVSGAVGSYAWDEGDGNWRLVVEKPENATALFTKEAIVGEFNYSHTDIDGRINDMIGVFRNENNNYNEDRVRVFDQPHIDAYGRRASSLVLVGCTNRQEALRRLKIRQLSSLKETRQVNFVTNRQGHLVQPFSVILVADGDLANDTLLRTTGRLIGRTNTTVTVRDTLRLEVGVTYRLHVTVPNPEYKPDSTVQPTHPDWRKPTITLVRNITNTASQRGDITVVGIDQPLPANTPANAQIALEAVGLPTLPKQYRVIEVEPQDNELVSITAIEVYTNKWNESDAVDEDAILAQRPVKTIPAPVTPEGGMFSVRTFEAEFQTKRVMTVRWERPGSIWIDGFKVEYSLNDGPWQTFSEKTQDNYVELQQPQNGRYAFRITTIDRRGGVSLPLVGTYELADTAQDYAPRQDIGPLADRPSVGSREGDKYTTNDQNPNLTYIWSNGQWYEESNFVETADQIKYIDPVTGLPTVPVQSLKPNEPGADVTGNNTSKDTNNVGGRPVADVLDVVDKSRRDIDQLVEDITNGGGSIGDLVDQAELARDLAQQARNDAQSARNAAELASQTAGDYVGQVETSKDIVEAAVDVADKAAEAAQLAKDAADEARDKALENADKAKLQADSASGFASTASGKADIATRKADEAGEFASLANASAILAGTKASDASLSESNAVAANRNAQGAASAALTSQNLAARASLDGAANSANDNRAPGAALSLWSYNQFNNFVTTNRLTGNPAAFSTVGGGHLRIVGGWHVHPVAPTRVQPGKRYRAYARFRITEDVAQPNGHILYVTFFDSNGGLLAGNTLSLNIITTTSVAAGWQELSRDFSSVQQGTGTFLTPEGTAYARVMYRSSGAPTELALLYIEDVEAQRAAESFAKASNESASTAAASADASGQSASASDTSRQRAETAKGQAESFSSSAALSESNAGKSASAAAISATVSAGSADQAIYQAARGITANWAELRNFVYPWENNLFAKVRGQRGVDSPIISFVDVPGEGRVVQEENGNSSIWVTNGYLKLETANTYIVEGRWRMVRLATNSPNGHKPHCYFGWAVYNAAGEYIGNYYVYADYTDTLNTWIDVRRELTTEQFRVNHPTAAYVSPLTILNHNDNQAGLNSAMQVSKLTTRNGTAEKLARESANASSTSASFASASETQAGKSATASETSRQQAESLAGQALAYRNTAADHAQNAESSSSDARASAGVASESRLVSDKNAADLFPGFETNGKNWSWETQNWVNGTGDVAWESHEKGSGIAFRPGMGNYLYMAPSGTGGAGWIKTVAGRRYRAGVWLWQWNAQDGYGGNARIYWEGDRKDHDSSGDYVGATANGPAATLPFYTAVPNGAWHYMETDLAIDSAMAANPLRYWVRPRINIDNIPTRAGYVLAGWSLRDVTSEFAAASSATAASGSSSSASTFADNSRQSASAAEGYKNTAQTQAGLAETSRSSAATSERNAKGSENAAASSATLSATTAQDAGGAATAPRSPGASPSNWVSNQFSQMVATTNLRVQGYTAPNGILTVPGAYHIGPTAVSPVDRAKRYRMGATIRIAATTAGNQAELGHLCFVSWFAADGTFIGSPAVEIYTGTMNAGQTRTLTRVLGAEDIPVNAAFFKVHVRTNNYCTTEIHSIYWTDVEAEEAAKDAASASNASAGTAAASANTAGQQASAANQSRIDAQTAKGQAELAKTDAVKASQDASGSANSAATSQRLAASASAARGLTDNGMFAAGDVGWSTNMAYGTWWQGVGYRSAPSVRGTISYGKVIPVQMDRAYRLNTAFVVHNATQETYVGLSCFADANATQFLGNIYMDTVNVTQPSGSVVPSVSSEYSGVTNDATPMFRRGTQFPAATRYVQPMAYLNYGQATNGISDLNALYLEDITSEKAARGSASAANESAGSASAKSTEAGNSASAANQSRIDAQAANGAAKGYAEAAQGSAVNANQSASQAQTYATLSSSFSAASSNKNDKFANWTTATNVPDYYNQWVAEGNWRFSRVTGSGGSPYAVYTQNDGSNVNSGFFQGDIAIYPGHWVLEATVRVDANNIRGAGIWTDVGAGINFAVDADTAGVIDPNSQGRIRTFSRLFRTDANTTTNLYAMHGWTGFGEVHPRYMTWYMVRLRPATQAEINGNKALDKAITNEGRIEDVNTVLATDIGAVATRVTNVESRAGDLESGAKITQTAVTNLQTKQAAARIELQAVTPGGRAAVVIRSDNNGGAGVDITGDLRIVGDKGGYQFLLSPKDGQFIIYDPNGIDRIFIGVE